jgi:hypothetical protein
MSYNLFLDDFRFPYDAYKYTHQSIYKEKEWVIVRNYDEFVNYIIKHSIPDIISFDHDLGYEHYNNYSHGDVIDYDMFNEKTGYDCAKWLIDQYIVIPKILIHTMNPPAGLNIFYLMKNWQKHNNIAQNVKIINLQRK